MTLCLPFLMFQGRAQEAIDHYLETFPDAELLEVQHHPEGTEIFDPAADAAEEAAEETPERQDEDSEGEDLEEPDATEEDPESEDVAEDEETESEGTASQDQDSEQAPESEQDLLDDATIQLPAITEDSHPEDSPIHAEAEDQDEAPAEPPTLVATAQLRIGGQVLMLQDSLVRHQFSFTPSTSIAVVVDSAAEFDQIVGRLSEGGQYLMEPGDYDFAQNFAWVTDRFGVSWQVNHPLGSRQEETTRAKAPEWG